ncbi:hypothetical protein D9758_007352 [Tetrapyrgos nigripes]|uniref:Actin-related protein 5 n=1 Tax=Tetrapyrgos nigripes TaxID=182062 RepID=A0A8H5GAX7_9AGAR|nr:hypothetical protein D9758_007352 [Tetrapyrgos nigripes]
MTERLCSPLHSRALTSELMFEQYRVPSLAYCVDGIMSFYHNSPPSSSGIVISFNTASTSIIPILHGRGILSHAKRLPWGSSQSTDYLLKLIQLKYPNFPTRVTQSQAAWMLHNFCSFMPNPNPTPVVGTTNTYLSLLRTFSKDPSTLTEHTAVVQFPWSSSPLNTFDTNSGPGRSTPDPATADAMSIDPSSEQAKLEKRREQGKKLQEISAKARLEKLKQKEEDLAYLLELRRGRREEGGDYYVGDGDGDGDVGDTSHKDDIDEKWLKRLVREGFDDEKRLDDTIKKFEASLRKSKAKDKDASQAPEDQQPVEPEEPSYPLLSIPDTDLTEDQLREKRKQKLLKAGYDARVRAKREKALKEERERVEREREREEREREEKEEEEEREENFGGWKRRLRGEQEALISRIKARSRRRAALNTGDRKSAAAQARMKNIANLAGDERVNPKSRNKYSGTGGVAGSSAGAGSGGASGGGGKRKDKGEDMFGLNDEDWAIYHKIAKRNEPPSSDSEQEDLSKLSLIEQKLLTHDPSFTFQDTHASLSHYSQHSAILAAFKPSFYGNANVAVAGANANPGVGVGVGVGTPSTAIGGIDDIASQWQIHLNTERYRVCETWFEPGLAGVDCAGLGELVMGVLNSVSNSSSSTTFLSSSSPDHSPDSIKRLLTSNILLTGTPSLLPGLIPRLHEALRPVLPVDLPIQIRRAEDPGLDAWRGMARFAGTEEFGGGGGGRGVSMTREEYEEYGGERVKRWWGGNWNGGY